MAEFNSNTESGCIAGNLPLKVMRVAMENKGLLAEAGTLYCGTGEKISITIDNETYNIPKTIAVDPPSENGVQDGVTYGIKFTLDTDNKVKSAILVPVQPK